MYKLYWVAFFCCSCSVAVPCRSDCYADVFMLALTCLTPTACNPSQAVMNQRRHWQLVVMVLVLLVTGSTGPVQGGRPSKALHPVTPPTPLQFMHAASAIAEGVKAGECYWLLL